MKYVFSLLLIFALGCATQPQPETAECAATIEQLVDGIVGTEPVFDSLRELTKTIYLKAVSEGSSECEAVYIAAERLGGYLDQLQGRSNKRI